MADSTYKDPNGQAPGQSTEKVNSTTGEAGVYRHPVSGEEIITLYDPLYGNAQSEAAIRVGFVRVRDTKEGDIQVLGAASVAFENRPQAGQTATDDAIKGLLARVNAVEAENAQLREAQAKGTTVDAAHGVPGGEAAKADGEAQAQTQIDNTSVEPIANTDQAATTTATASESAPEASAASDAAATTQGESADAPAASSDQSPNQTETSTASTDAAASTDGTGNNDAAAANATSQEGTK